MRKIKSNKVKPRVAIVSLTSCEGCQFAIMDLGEKFLDLLKRIDLGEFRLIEEEPDLGEYDIAFVEGNPVTSENIKLLNEIRNRSKYLVVLGNCAALGGVVELRNYIGREKAIRHIYKETKGIENPAIKEIDNFVKVDFTIPGCPINATEFLKVLDDLLAGKEPEIPKRPVCYECPLAGADCLLQKGEPCLGPMILGGCEAVCTKSNMPCQGCRGILKDTDINPMRNLLIRMMGVERLNRIFEIFGIRDDVEQRLRQI